MASKTRVNDKSYLLDSTLTQLSSNIIENQDLDHGLGTQLIRTGLVVGGGAEYNISGTTSLFFALHYHYFVTNALTKENNEKFLRKYDLDNQQFENVGAKSIPGSVSLTIGVLF